jgi:hypothetical protein
VQEQREAIGARADNGERRVGLRVAPLQDSYERVGQLVTGPRFPEKTLGLVDQVRLERRAGLRAGPGRHLAEAGDQSRSGQNFELVGHRSVNLLVGHRDRF